MPSNAHHAHKAKMAAKAARNSNPAARAAQLVEINAPGLQRNRLASIKAIGLDIASKNGTEPAEFAKDAVDAFIKRERNIANRVALKTRRSARTYKSNGPQETDRRARQIEAGQIQVTEDVT